MRPHVTGCESVTRVWGGVNAWRSWSRSSSAGVQLTLKRVRVHILPVMFSVFSPLSNRARSLSLSPMCAHKNGFFLFCLFYFVFCAMTTYLPRICRTTVCIISPIMYIMSTHVILVHKEAASAREDPEGANSDPKCSYLMPPSVVSKLRRKFPFFRSTSLTKRDRF